MNLCTVYTMLTGLIFRFDPVLHTAAMLCLVKRGLDNGTARKEETETRIAALKQVSLCAVYTDVCT